MNELQFRHHDQTGKRAHATRDAKASTKRDRKWIRWATHSYLIIIVNVVAQFIIVGFNHVYKFIDTGFHDTDAANLQQVRHFNVDRHFEFHCERSVTIFVGKRHVRLQSIGNQKQESRDAHPAVTAVLVWCDRAKNAVSKKLRPHNNGKQGDDVNTNC